MNQHLVGIPGQMSSCKEVPQDVHHKMIGSLKQVQQRRQIEDLNKAYDDINQNEGEQEVEEVQP